MRIPSIMRMPGENCEALHGGHTQTLPVRPASQLATNTDIITKMRACVPRPTRVANNDHGRVFIVQAHPDQASFTASALEQAGYRTRAFDDAITAWHAFAFANPKPDVLITPEASGEMAGLELIRLCKELKPGLKTLLITSRHRFQLRRKERTLVDAVFHADCSSPRLAERVERLLQPERWDWRKLWGFLSPQSPKSHHAPA